MAGTAAFVAAGIGEFGTAASVVVGIGSLVLWHLWWLVLRRLWWLVLGSLVLLSLLCRLFTHQVAYPTCHQIAH